MSAMVYRPRQSAEPPVLSDAEAAHRYRLAQAHEIMFRFADAHGRHAADIVELAAWMRAQDWERPVVPRAAAHERVMTDLAD